MNEQELIAYLAGLFDAEGSILIDKKKPRWSNKSVQYILTVAVTNTRPELVRFIHQRHGGHVVGPVQTKEGQKPFYRWTLAGASARDFLRDIEPYLIVKRDRVALAYELQDRIDNYHVRGLGQGRGTSPMPNEEIAAREDIYQRFRRLNRRGLSQEHEEE